MITAHKNGSRYFDCLIQGLIIFFPPLFMSVPHVTTAHATLIAAACILALINYNSSFHFKNKEIIVILFVFFSYPIAIIISQIYWGRYDVSEYQQQGRILLLAPLFYYIYVKKINFSKNIKIIAPLTCLTACISSIYFFSASFEQWGGRHTISHIDPLNFGYLMLFLAFSSLLIAIRWTSNFWLRMFCIVAFFCGIYMSIRSGSRTGWLAVPLVLLWFLMSLKKIKITNFIIGFVVIVIAFFILYFSSEVVRLRYAESISDIKNYVWSGNPIANDTSIGIRISMVRMGLFCFIESPFFGFGTKNLYDILNNDSVRSYVSESTLKFSASGFMHNELLTQLVRHGIFGGLAYIFIVLSIIRLYLKLVKRGIKSLFVDVFMIYIIFALVASLSTEILVVKPMILFFGFMLACFSGEALWRIHEYDHAEI